MAHIIETKDAASDTLQKLSTSSSLTTSSNVTLPAIDTNVNNAGGSNGVLVGNNTSTIASGVAAGSGSGAAGATGAGPSHEVLNNFFLSLLSKKASSGTSPTSREELTTPTSTSPASAGTTARRATISRKDVHKELDRMRQYVNK